MRRTRALTLSFLLAVACATVALAATAQASTLSCASFKVGHHHFAKVHAGGVSCARAHKVLVALATRGQGTRLGFYCQEAGAKSNLSVVCNKGTDLIDAVDRET